MNDLLQREEKGSNVASRRKKETHGSYPPAEIAPTADYVDLPVARCGHPRDLDGAHTNYLNKKYIFDIQSTFARYNR